MASTTAKMVRFAPRQTARVTRAVAVNPGVLRSNRAAWRSCLAQFVEGVEAARFAAVFLDAVQAAELDAGAPCRFLRRHAGAHQVVRVLLDVKPQLLGHSLLEIAAGTSARAGVSEGGSRYTSSGVVLKAVAIAEASRFQPAVSSRRRRRPATVSV